MKIHTLFMVGIAALLQLTPGAIADEASTKPIFIPRGCSSDASVCQANFETSGVDADNRFEVNLDGSFEFIVYGVGMTALNCTQSQLAGTAPRLSPRPGASASSAPGTASPETLPNTPGNLPAAGSVSPSPSPSVSASPSPEPTPTFEYASDKTKVTMSMESTNVDYNVVCTATNAAGTTTFYMDVFTVT